jgi:hypothetical protein
MQISSISKRVAVAVVAGSILCLLGFTRQLGGDKGTDTEQMRIQRGFEISPVPLNLEGKERNLVGLGSYIVNTTGCTGCHTWPTWAPGGNPFLGQPERINTAKFLAGGRPMPDYPGIKSRNITPDPYYGLPAGLTLHEFMNVMQHGQDQQNPGRILKGMPWPLLGKKTDHELRAIYEYLSTIPSLPDNYEKLSYKEE